MDFVHSCTRQQLRLVVSQHEQADGAGCRENVSVALSPWFAFQEPKGQAGPRNKLTLILCLLPRVRLARTYVGADSHERARGEIPRPFGEGVGSGGLEAKGAREEGRGERRLETKEALDGAAKGGLGQDSRLHDTQNRSPPGDDR